MDIVYTLALNSLSGNQQLIFSLRSVEKYLTGFDNIFVVGADPKLKHVIHIPHIDTKSAANNIKDKLMLACEDTRISKQFLYMADDHYFLKPTEIKKYPYYANGYLEDLAKTQSNGYKKNVEATIQALKSIGCALRNYNTHCPIIYDKDKLKMVVGMVDWDNCDGYLMKSLYCNILGLYEEQELLDCKIGRKMTDKEIKERINDRHIFSTGQEYRKGFENIPRLLNELYPQKSIYE